MKEQIGSGIEMSNLKFTLLLNELEERIRVNCASGDMASLEKNLFHYRKAVFDELELKKHDKEFSSVGEH